MTLRLGLIGGNITQTRSPALHVACGLSIGLNVTYDLLIPQEQGLDLPAMLARCERSGFAGVNVTYPFKEAAIQLAEAGDTIVSDMGSSNTICFAANGPHAFNTDYTGFIAAFRARFGKADPGRTLVLGAGGVGRAVVFALAAIGASEIRLFDTDDFKTDALMAAVRHAFPHCSASKAYEPELLILDECDGVVNCTPLGMAGRPGSPLPANTHGKLRWAFDAVYTPEHTLFREQTSRLGAQFLPGWELYFHQGIHAFELFSGIAPDVEWVRAMITHTP
jgi:shikimate dehydrogenase